MGFKDYDYLTYNDLLNVQDDLMRIKGQRDPDLDVLIQSKKFWMDANGITGYKEIIEERSDSKAFPLFYRYL